MKSAILFQAFNRKEFTKRALEHHLASDKHPHRLVISDNGSTDGTREYLQELEKSGLDADFIYYTKNFGRDRVRNHFFNEYRHKYQYLGLFANDVLVSPGWVQAFEHVLDKVATVGIIGPVDRAWGTRDLKAFENTSYYGGHHFCFSDAFWLMRATMISEIQKKVKLKVGEGKKVPHPGFVPFNLFSLSQEIYWSHIRAAGYETACHPHHWMKFICKDTPITAEWHKKYTVLTKRVYCTNPEKYLAETAGQMTYEIKGQMTCWGDEPDLCKTCPDEILQNTKKKPLAQLDDGVTEDDMRLLNEHD